MLRQKHLRYFSELNKFTYYVNTITSYNLTNLFEFLREIRQNLSKDMQNLKAKLPNFVPSLAIVQVGGREDSNVYIRMKIKAANDIGIAANHIKLPNTTTEIELINKINKLNDDRSSCKCHSIQLIISIPI